MALTWGKSNRVIQLYNFCNYVFIEQSNGGGAIFLFTILRRRFNYRKLKQRYKNKKHNIVAAALPLRVMIYDEWSFLPETNLISSIIFVKFLACVTVVTPIVIPVHHSLFSNDLSLLLLARSCQEHRIKSVICFNTFIDDWSKIGAIMQTLLASLSLWRDFANSIPNRAVINT